MNYALFLGCTIPVRSQNYEMSARNVAKKLGIHLVDVDDFSCCGFPVKSTNSETSLAIAARNLAIASKKKLDICTLCNACASVLTEATKTLSENDTLRKKINDQLKKMNLTFEPGIKIKHFSRLLYEDYSVNNIRDKIEEKLDSYKLSIHYGCHYLRPSDIYDCFDDAENPVSLDKLIKITGAKVIDYENKLDCCGGAILGVKEDISLKMAHEKLKKLKEKKVDALVTICPFCSIMYEDNQRKIESKFETEYNLPVLFYPQILGLSLGIEYKKLGLHLNKIKTKEFLEKGGFR